MSREWRPFSVFVLGRLFLAAAALLFLVPALTSMMSTSRVPVFWGRYSAPLLIVNTGIGALYGLTLLSLLTKNSRRWLLFLVLAGFAGLSFLIIGNNSVKSIPGVALLCAALRFLLGCSLLFFTFGYYRTQHHKPEPGLAAAFALIALSLSDFALTGILHIHPKSEYNELESRVDYGFHELTKEDIVLTGDSFVWGGGVHKKERVGDQLEELFRASGGAAKVLSLGIPGGAPGEYADALKRMPAGLQVKRVVTAFYLNDIPNAPTLTNQFYTALVNLEKASVSLKFFCDVLGKKLWSDVERYHRSIAAMYDPESPMMEARWRLLTEQIQRLSRIARPHSIEKPIFIIIPLMMNYENYPLRAAHQQISEVAEKAGFETLDLLPSFEKRLKDGNAYRAAANDNHMNAEAHRLAAEILYSLLNPSLQAGGTLNGAAPELSAAED